MSETTREQEKKQDHAVEETFPASDPPAQGGSTGPNDGRKAPSDTPARQSSSARA